MSTGSEPKTVWRYRLAILIASVVVPLRVALEPWLGPTVPLAAYVGAVLYVTWRGGTGPGLLTVGLAAAGDLAWNHAGEGLIFQFLTRRIRLIVLVGCALMALLVGRIVDRARRRTDLSPHLAKERRAWLQAMLPHIGDPVIATDADGQVVTLNPAAEALNGWTSAEAAGRRISEVAPAGDGSLPAPADHLMAALEGTLTPRSSPTGLRSRSGETRTGLADASIIPGTGGSIAGALLVLRPAEPLRSDPAVRAASVEVVFQELIDGIDQIIWTTFADGTVEFCNRRGLDYTGLTFEDLKRGWTRMVHPDDAPRIFALREKSRASGEKFEFEYRIRRASDWAYRWHLGRVWPLLGEHGQTVRWLG
ncbi:MAG: PAS domain S-box protein, partial [Isosphaeraceae bacterium]